DSFAYVAKMGIDGSLSLARVSFAIVGVNDLPTINGLSTGGATENGPAATGTLVVVDPDTGQSSMTASTQTGGWGTLNMGTDGAWTYALGATQDALNAGETHEKTFIVTSADGTAHTITITRNGINNVPLADDASADASEGGAVITGTVTSSDLDAYNTATYAVPGTVPAGLTFNADGSWSFDPTDGAYDSLAEGETQLVEVPYTVTDDQNTSDTGMLVITVTGTNDAPVAEAASASVDEDSSTGGQLSASDADDGADLSFASDSDAQGFDLDSDGSWSIDTTGEDYQYLGVGESTDVEVEYTVTDEYDATGTATLTITVYGVNDAPEAENDSFTVYEDDPIYDGSVTAADADASAVLTFALNSVVAGLSMDADGSYSFDASDDAYQSLPAGATLPISVDYTVTDDQGATDVATLDIIVIGTNDLAYVTGDSGTVTEDTQPFTIFGDLSVTDVDDGEDAFQTPADLSGDYGDFTFDPESGNWSYTMDNDAAQSLEEGDSATDTLDVLSADGTGGATITVTINGLDEPEVVVNYITGWTVNHGLQWVNERVEFVGFDDNDVLNPSNNYAYTGFSLIDTDGDDVMDSTQVDFHDAGNGKPGTSGSNGTDVHVILVGYMDFTTAQVTV
ncbi:MAG: VCBS domain-containing protein, partial [Ramlibacter sp.]